MSLLVKVNGLEISTAQALRRSLLNPTGFLQQTIEDLLIQDYAARNDIINSDTDLQKAADEFRYQLGLETLESLNQGIQENHLTLLDFQEGLEVGLLKTKVFRSFSDEEVEAYFLEHHREIDRIELYVLAVDSESKARELQVQLEEEDANFHLLTREHSTDEETRVRGGYLGNLSRRDLPGDVEQLVFDTREGSVVGPIASSDDYRLYKVSKIHQAVLTELAIPIKLELYDNLVSQLKKKAKLEYPVFDHIDTE